MATVRDASHRVLHDDRVVVGRLRNEPRALLADAGLLLGLVARRDVDEREHGAVDAVVGGAVGQEAHQIPAATLALDFALDELERLKRFLDVLGERRVLERMRDIEERTADRDRGRGARSC